MKYIVRMIFAAILFFTANIPVLIGIYISPWWTILILPCFLFINIKPSFYNNGLAGNRIRICGNGCELLILFLISMIASAIALPAMIPVIFSDHKILWFVDLLCVILVESVVFWNGIIRVYGTSAREFDTYINEKSLKAL